MSIIIPLLAAALLVAIDQITKALVVADFTLGESRTFIPGLLDFTYINNGGAAFGMLQGLSWILLSVSSIVIVICLAMLLKKAYRSKLMMWAVTIVMAGGIGNVIDRIFRGGCVVDFLELKFIKFPIFNFADCCVTIGAALFILEFVIDLVKESKAKKQADSEEQ